VLESAVMRKAKRIWSDLKRVARPQTPLDLLVAVWPAMVGPRLAGHTRPVAWKKGRIEVSVRDQDWRKQLDRLAEQVRKRINAWWGAELVHRVTFTEGRPPSPGHPGS